MTGEQKRLVRRLMERCAHEVDFKGTIDFFGLDETLDDPFRAMTDAWDSLTDDVGYERPRPGSIAGSRRPNLRPLR
jgi:hypothetical protein